MALDPRKRARLRLGYSVARAAGMSHAGSLLATGQGERESCLGMARPFLLANGDPSYNWGATTVRTSAIPSFGGTDKDQNGKVIGQRWARWPSLSAGFRYWSTFGSVRRAWNAYDAGDEREVARILYVGGYYTGIEGSDADRIAGYAALLRAGRAEVLEALSGSAGRVALAGAAAVGAWLAWRYAPGLASDLLP